MFVCLTLAASILGCADTAMYQTYPSEQLGTSTATVRVTRGYGPATGIGADIYVNNNLIGRIGPGGELSTPVPTGPLRVRSGTNTVTVQAQAGIVYTYEVSLSSSMQLAEARFDIALVSARNRDGAVVSQVGLQQPVVPSAADLAKKAPAKPLGEWTYAVERVARDAKCAAEPIPQLTAKGPGYETYIVPCFSGDALAVRCEFGNCRALR